MTRFALAYTALALIAGTMLFGSLYRLDASLARQAVERQEAYRAEPRGVDMAELAR